MSGPVHHPWRVAAGGFLVLAAAMGVGRFVYTPILPYMVEQVGLSPSQAGWIASANFVGYLAGALGAAFLTRLGSKWWWFMGGLALSAGTTAAMGLVSDAIQFAVLRFIGGVASAIVLVFSSTVILERLTQAGRSGLTAVYFGGVGAGIALSAVLVPQTAELGGSWQTLWFASGAFAAAVLCLSWIMIPYRPEVTADGGSNAASQGGKNLIALIMAYGLFGFGYVITATFISAMARESDLLRPYEAEIWLAVGLAAVPSVAVWTWFGRIIGNRKAFAIACLMEAVGVSMSVLADGPIAVALAAALLGGTFMGITALGLVQARAVATDNPQRAVALMTAAFGLGQVIGPSVAGAMYDASGSLTVASLIAAGTLVLAALAVMAAPKADRV